MKLLPKVSDKAKNTSLRLHCSLVVAILYSFFQSPAAHVVNVWAPRLIGGAGMVMPQTVLLVKFNRWEGTIGGPACVHEN